MRTLSLGMLTLNLKESYNKCIWKILKKMGYRYRKSNSVIVSFLAINQNRKKKLLYILKI